MGRRAVIDRAKAAAAALEIIDEEGLDALTFPRVAKSIGVSGPTLYYHFTDKEDLLSEVVRRIVFEAEIPATPSRADWREWVVHVAAGLRERTMRHPNASPLLLRLYSQEINLPIYERSARVLSGVGLSPQQQLLIVEGVEKLIMSSILETVGRLEPKSEVLDGERFPFLRTMLTEAELDEDRLFSETVYRLLDGVAPPAVDEPPEPLSIEA